MFCDPPEGDGKCSACHGTGFVEFFDAIALELLNVELRSCEECNGSRRCPTCSGTGVIEEVQIQMVA
jgi:DnaJ-class molecular chaperone